MVVVVEIQVLMGSLLYLRQGIENSPYAHLFDPIAWIEIADVFIHDACTLLGLSVDSPLSIVYVCLYLSKAFIKVSNGLLVL